MSAEVSILRQFSIFANVYYWRTAVLIARSGLVKQYRNSFLGMLWTLLQPLSVIAVYSVIMPMIMRVPVEHYPLYIICTLPLWQFISTSITGSTASLIGQAETLKRCIISCTVFPVADVLRGMYTYAIAFGTMYMFAVGVMRYPTDWHVLLLPLYLLPTFLTVMALSVGIAFVAPYVRDIGEALHVVFNMMIWFSAVIIPLEVLPDWAQAILVWNPLYILMQPAILLVHGHTLPGPDIMHRVFLVLGTAVTASYLMYRACRRNFVYYL